MNGVTLGHVTAVSITVHTVFQAGCVCGWVGPRRSGRQSADADTIQHRRAVPTFTACGDPHCPACSAHREQI